MDNITMNEMMAFTKEISSRDVTIAQLKNIVEKRDQQLAEAYEKIKSLEMAMERLKMMLEKAEAIRMMYHTYIVLQKEKVKRFFTTVHDIAVSSVCYTLLMKSVPDDAPKEMLEDINELSKVEHEKEMVQNVFMADSHCVVANGDVKENKFNM